MQPLNFYPFTRDDLDPQIRARLTGEARMIEKIVSALQIAGWNLTCVDDGGDEAVVCGTPREVLVTVFSVDEATLTVTRFGEDGKRQRGSIYFVLGNAPEEIAADWSECLSGVIDPVVLAPSPSEERPRGMSR
ncbi:MAG: hypothetical protein U0974_11890 [Gemmatimonadales bacterium]|nr:hypothetical protein [Gemmatimonadales bacterium]